MIGEQKNEGIYHHYIIRDIAVGILTTRTHQESPVTLFIDIGTNGESVLGNKEWLVSASCSAGFAFEGGEVLSPIGICGTFPPFFSLILIPYYFLVWKTSSMNMKDKFSFEKINAARKLLDL